MRFINFRIIELSCAIVLGILASEWTILPLSMLLLVPLFWGILLLIYYRDRSQFQTSLSFPLLSFLLFFQIGYWLGDLQQRIYESKVALYNVRQNDPDLWLLKIEEIGKSDTTYHRYLAQIVKFQKGTKLGRVSLSIKKDSSPTELKINDQLLAIGRLRRIAMSPNPYQFNFAKYMARKGVLHSMTLENNQIKYHTEGLGSLHKWASDLRNRLIKNLKRAPISQEVHAITQALTLGDRTAIDTDLYTAYSKAGAVHILAVSGLHVGIIMILLNQLFAFLLRLPKGRIIRVLLVVSLLWSYAFLTGFSPSVVRAVSMFSFFCFGNITDRPTHGINTLFLSFLITIIIAPHWLYQVGFQLSYFAVASILLLQPQFQRVWHPKHWLTRKAWEILTVSLSAQIGVAPLSLFYFHQFPGLFWFTNLVLLPLLPFILLYAFALVFLANWQLLPSFLYEAFELLVSNMNTFIRWTAHQESFLWKSGNITLTTLLLIYLIVVAFIISKRTLLTKTLLSTLCLLIIAKANTVSNNLKPSQLIWFHLKGESCLVIEETDSLKIFSSLQFQEEKYPIKNYLGGTKKPFKILNTMPSIFQFNETTYIVIDSIGSYPKTQNAGVIITQNPRLHADRMLEEIHPRFVVADGSNYQSTLQRWANSCKKRKIPFYQTATTAFAQKAIKKFP